MPADWKRQFPSGGKPWPPGVRPKVEMKDERDDDDDDVVAMDVDDRLALIRAKLSKRRAEDAARVSNIRGRARHSQASTSIVSDSVSSTPVSPAWSPATTVAATAPQAQALEALQAQLSMLTGQMATIQAEHERELAKMRQARDESLTYVARVVLVSWLLIRGRA